MPRGRGGAREGTPGRAYSNRSDLNINRAAPGQQYGKAAAQEQAMSAVPLQAPAAPAPDLTAIANEGWEPLPGNPTQTSLPDEPVTAGLPTGPGPGPEVLAQLAPQASPDLENLLPYLGFFEKLASQPDATSATRILFRSLLSEKLSRGL